MDRRQYKKVYSAIETVSSGYSEINKYMTFEDARDILYEIDQCPSVYGFTDSEHDKLCAKLIGKLAGELYLIKLDMKEVEEKNTGLKRKFKKEISNINSRLNSEDKIESLSKKVEELTSINSKYLDSMIKFRNQKEFLVKWIKNNVDKKKVEYVIEMIGDNEGEKER